MAKRMSFLVAASLVVAGAIPVVAQMGMHLPSIRGVWNPVVGGGAQYEQVDSDGSKHPITIAIIGKEDVSGATGYWMEVGMTRDAGDFWIQNLMVLTAPDLNVAKSIVQMPGRGPIEMPAAMMGRGQAPPPKVDLKTDSERVGNESVTTPAGTFDCEHWRAKDGSYDAWISTKVTPWGLVKGSGPHGTLTLVKVVSDAKSHITGTPQKFDPSMMGRRGN
jgi:hypothetical protein